VCNIGSSTCWLEPDDRDPEEDRERERRDEALPFREEDGRALVVVLGL